MASDPLDVQTAKKVASVWLERAELLNAIDFGLPEIDDRYHIWRVPLISKLGGLDFTQYSGSSAIRVDLRSPYHC